MIVKVCSWTFTLKKVLLGPELQQFQKQRQQESGRANIDPCRSEEACAVQIQKFITKNNTQLTSLHYALSRLAS